MPAAPAHCPRCLAVLQPRSIPSHQRTFACMTDTTIKQWADAGYTPVSFRLGERLLHIDHLLHGYRHPQTQALPAWGHPISHETYIERKNRNTTQRGYWVRRWVDCVLALSPSDTPRTQWTLHWLRDDLFLAAAVDATYDLARITEGRHAAMHRVFSLLQGGRLAAGLPAWPRWCECMEHADESFDP